MRSLSCSRDRSDLEYVFPRRVAVVIIAEHCGARGYQYDADDEHGFHVA
jgi:hypothetical protein